MNKAKRKLLISVLVMMFILISVVATVAIIFAATQQTITTTLNMTYTAENIYGSVKGSYTIGGVTESLTASTGGEDLVFRGEPLQNGTLSFPTEQIDMTSEASEMILQYTFTNSGRRHYIATMSFESVIDPYNMKIQYSIDGDVYSDQRYAVVVQDESTRSYWIKISVDNKADNASFKGDFIWNLEDTEDMDEATYLSLSTLEFQGSDGAYSASISEAGDFVGTITFPSEVNGDNVTTINRSSLSNADKAKVTSVYIPDSVETIGNGAFKDFTKLEEVTFEQNETAGSSSVSAQSGTGLKIIDNDAFNSCSSLSSITIPNSVTSIGDLAFLCTGLREINIPDNVTSVGMSVFQKCTNLQSATIGKGLKTIPFDLLIECINLKNIVISSENSNYHVSGNCVIHTTNKQLIFGCKTSVIPTDGSVTSIGMRAFYNCTTLTNIEIPNSVTSIGNYAFEGCINLKNITLNTMNSSVLTAVKTIASTNSDVNLTIGSVTEIPDYAFCDENTYTGTHGLTNVTFGDSVTSIGRSAFRDCTGLTSLIIPGNVETIGASAFYGCTNLKDLTIQDGVKVIGDTAFGSCDGLTEVVVPDSVTSVELYAFNSCENLEKLEIGKGATNIGNGFTVVSNCPNLTTLKVSSENQTYKSLGNCIIHIAGKYTIAGCKNSVIPTDGSVTTLGAYTFERCAGLTTINIPSSITYISFDAFNQCSDLVEIYFEKTDGWYGKHLITEEIKQYDPTELADPEKAAELVLNSAPWEFHRDAE